MSIGIRFLGWLTSYSTRVLINCALGFASRETLLYGPEIKFYSNKIEIDKNFETNVKGLYCLGDSSGWTRGLMMASAMGVMMGRNLADN